VFIVSAPATGGLSFHVTKRLEPAAAGP